MMKKFLSGLALLYSGDAHRDAAYFVMIRLPVAPVAAFSMLNK